MERPKILRALRLTTSAICLLFCVAFVGLWVRSYSWHDSAHCPLPGKTSNPGTWRIVTLRDGTQFEPSPRMLIVSSSRGRLSLRAGEANPYRSGGFPWGWGTRIVYIGDRTPSAIATSWNYQSDQYGKHVRVPHWLPALVFGALAAAFGIRRVPYRFSMRTLLVTMTIAAVALGLIVWARGS